MRPPGENWKRPFRHIKNGHKFSRRLPGPCSHIHINVRNQVCLSPGSGLSESSEGQYQTRSGASGKCLHLPSLPFPASLSLLHTHICIAHRTCTKNHREWTRRNHAHDNATLSFWVGTWTIPGLQNQFLFHCLFTYLYDFFIAPSVSVSFAIIFCFFFFLVNLFYHQTLFRWFGRKPMYGWQLKLQCENMA